MTQRLKFASACIVLVLGVLVFSSSAQQTTQTTSQPLSPSPYQVGERLTYNVSFSNFISAAHVEMLVSGRGMFFGREGIQLKGHVETNGVVNAALFAINNDYITYVDSISGLPYHGQQIVRETTRTLETAADFNQPAGTAAIPARITNGFPGTYDLFSALYRIRSLPLKSGEKYTLSVRHANQNFQIDVRVNGQEVIRTNVGSFNTIVTQLRLKSDDGDSYTSTVHFSDDQRHVPVLAVTRVRTGEITAELAGSGFVATAPAPPPSPTPTPTPTPGSTPRPPLVIPPAPKEDDLVGLPFKVGEQLNYQIFLPNIKAPIATASFHVEARSKYFDHDGFRFTLSAQTTNALQKLFVANDSMISYVDPKTLLPFHTEFTFSEGRNRLANKLTFNQDYGTVTGEKGERTEIPIGTHDYLSYFYLVRTFNLASGKRNAISLLVNNKPKTIFVTVLRREAIQVGLQNIPSISVSLTTDDPQADKFELRAWISDDKRRLPLRLTAVTDLGPIRADLAIIPVTPQ